MTYSITHPKLYLLTLSDIVVLMRGLQLAQGQGLQGVEIRLSSEPKTEDISNNRMKLASPENLVLFENEGFANQVNVVDIKAELAIIQNPAERPQSGVMGSALKSKHTGGNFSE